MVCLATECVVAARQANPSAKPLNDGSIMCMVDGAVIGEVSRGLDIHLVVFCRAHTTTDNRLRRHLVQSRRRCMRCDGARLQTVMRWFRCETVGGPAVVDAHSF